MKIAEEALPIALVVAVASVAAVLLLHPLAAVAGLPILAFVLWFFRDPERSTPSDPTSLVSPADGRIIRAGPDRVSIFMGLFDVHVCRSPAAGRLESVEHRSGRFFAAFKDRASEQNERVSIVLHGADGPLRFNLVAGLVARRIVCKVSAGQQVEAGQRVGLIRFGSRVDVDLPPGAEAMVACGDRTVAGQTPIARLASAPASPAGDSRGAGSSTARAN
jgi:phosphatidylserine decarboxylase